MGNFKRKHKKMKHEIFKTDTPELVAISIDGDNKVTFATTEEM